MRPSVTPDSSGGAGAATARASAPSRMATISAARSAFPPIATAWSACVPDSAPSRRSIPERPRTANRRRTDGRARTAHAHGARRTTGTEGDGARRSTRLAVDRRADAGPPPPRPIKVAIVPEVPGGTTHPARSRTVRLAGRLAAAGYVVEELLPPDIERGIELWHMICVTDLLADCGRNATDGRCRRIASMGWLACASPPTWRATSLRSRARRVDAALDVLLAAVAAGNPADARRPAAEAQGQRDRGGPGRLLQGLRSSLIAPLLGLPSLAVPVGSHGKLRTGRLGDHGQARNREDLCWTRVK